MNFLTFRSHSRRNPYTRNILHVVKIAIRNLVQSDKCPRFVRNSFLYIANIFG